MIETELQHKEIMPFFCKPEESGGIGYRETEPGKADIEMTKKLVEASKIMGIPLLDHLVLGAVDAANGKGFVSMRESGLVRF